jgi:hypothetical protein
MIMKNASDSFKVLFAHVELGKARFLHGEDMGIDFHNQIDAWTKMEVVFREQIKLLKECKTLDTNRTKRPKKNKGDLKPLCYSIREKIE